MSYLIYYFNLMLYLNLLKLKLETTRFIDNKLKMAIEKDVEKDILVI
jgi:hypothetical protein